MSRRSAIDSGLKIVHSIYVIEAMICAVIALKSGRQVRSVFRRSTEFEHVDQARQAASSAFEEITVQNFLGSGAILDVDSQTLAEEDFELTAELVGVLESWCAIGGDQEKSFERLFVQVRRFGLDHLNSHDAEGPHIHFATIFFLLDDFRCHPIRRANHSSALGFLIGKLGAETEVGWGQLLV